MADPTADQVVIWWKELKQLLQTPKTGLCPQAGRTSNGTKSTILGFS